MKKGLKKNSNRVYFKTDIFLEEVRKFMKQERLPKKRLAKIFFDVSYAKLNDMGKEGFAGLTTIGKFESKGFKFSFIEKR